MHLEPYIDAFTHRDWETASPSGTVRIAIIGVGSFARTRAIPAIESTSYCSPTALVSGSNDIDDVARSHGIDVVLTYEEFLEGQSSEEYDAVYIATPNATHGEYAISAAERGKHVICEKPLETDVSKAEDVIHACEAADVTLMVAYRLQFEPSVRRTREMIADGVIGDVVQIHAGFSHPLLSYSGQSDWRLDATMAGGGALVDLGIYPLNTIRFLLGLNPVAVSATIHSSGPIFSDVEKHVAFQLEFPEETTASCTASFSAHPASTLQIIGTDGIVGIKSPFGGIVPQDMYVEVGDIGMEYCGEPVDEVREEFAYFGYTILTGEELGPNGRDGLTDVRIMRTTYDSADRRTWIEF